MLKSAKSKGTSEDTPPRGIYLLPNLLTTGGLFAGFYAIVVIMNGSGRFDIAAAAIFIAMIADALDGRVARLTNTQSAFGAEYDSLSDMVAFGVAPALVAYNWSLLTLGKIGWLVAFWFTAAGGLRLARFNIRINADTRYFYGLPIPAAAAVVASTVWVGSEYNIPGVSVRYVVAIITAVTAFLMVSNIRYYSFKKIDFRGKVPFITGFIVVLAYVFITLNPPLVLFIVFVGYGISGPLFALWRKRKTKKHLSHSVDEQQESQS